MQSNHILQNYICKSLFEKQTLFHFLKNLAPALGPKNSWHFATIVRNSYAARIMCHVILTSIVFVKLGWDNFAGRRSRLSGLFCNSDRDRIERCWVSANLSPQFHKWPNFCEDLFFFSLPSNLKQTLGRQTTPPDFLLILASNHLWEWNTNRPTNSHRSDPSDGTGNGKIRLINI